MKVIDGQMRVGRGYQQVGSSVAENVINNCVVLQVRGVEVKFVKKKFAYDQQNNLKYVNFENSKFWSDKVSQITHLIHLDMFTSMCIDLRKNSTDGCGVDKK